MPHEKPTHSDAQVRITRRCLIGTGIVSGLELALDDNHQICITPGKGLTSDGKYTEVHTTRLFSFYRDFMPDTSYEFFQDKNGEIIPLWELVPEHSQEGDQPLSPQYEQESRNPFLKDKVVLLYLDENINQNDDADESSEEDADDDQQELYHQQEKGQGAFIQRFLLIRLEDLLQKLNVQQLATQIVWQILEDDEDYIYSDFYNPDDDRPRPRDINKALNPALRLPEVHLRRFGFSKGDPYDCPPEGVDQSVFPELISLDDIYEGYRPAIDEAIEDLDAALNKLYEFFNPILTKFPVWDIAETLDALCEKWESYKRKNQNEDASAHRKEYIQYFYDWLRDLIKAYHEIRAMLIDFTFISITDANEFPLHLLLGEPLREEAANIPRPFRQHFKQPPIYNGQADRLQAVRLYFWRILVMIKNFYLPGYINKPKIDFCNTEEPEEDLDFDQLKVTPGKYYDELLEVQSMPYYYFPIARHRFSLHHFWNFERTRNSSNDQILSYYASDSEDSYTDQLHVIRPLHYNLDTLSFFRIEGHIGKPVMDYAEEDKEMLGVLNQLHYIKRKYNLDFGIIALPISQAQPLSHTYQERQGPSDAFHSFHPSHLGMEHLAGVQKGGTFVIVYDEGRKVIADFSLAHQCCKYCISGWITDCLNEEVVQDISITISNTHDPEKSIPIQVDETGFFKKCLPIGTYILSINEAGDDRFEPYEQNINLDGDLISDIKLINKTGIIEGRIANNSNINLGNASTIFIISEDDTREAVVIKDQKFVIENIPVGEGKLQILNDDGNPISNIEKYVEVLPCQITKVDWVLEPEVLYSARPATENKPARVDSAKEKSKAKMPASRKDDLSIIKGIGDKTKNILHKNGITSYDQLADMTMEKYNQLEHPLTVTPQESWAKEARKLIKNK